MLFTTKAAALVAIAGALPQAFAHYNFDRLILNGAQTGQWEYVRALAQGQYNSPILDVTSKDIICNKGGIDSGSQTKTAPVTAGDTVGFTVNSNMGHPGPLTVYMSKATGNVSSYQGDGSWFKIYDAGVKTFASTNGQGLTWITDGVTQVSFDIPTAIEDGEYLLRVEHIATHQAMDLNGAQFYISCAQINVSGGAGGSPSPVGNFPGIYTATDPGIMFQPYWPPVTAYTLPGLAVYGGGGSGNADGSGKAGGANAGSGNAGSGKTSTAVASVTRAAATSLATSISAPIKVVSTTAAPAPTASGKACRQKKRRGVKGVYVA